MTKDDNGNYNMSYDRSYKCGVSPVFITKLQPNEVFVFGSNLQGSHGGGAARIALNRFGAIWGQGVGLQGQSYAIPTMQGPTSTIRPYVEQFIRFAKENPHMHFLVTKIGCGIAGFKPEQIAPLFRDAIDLENVSLPKEFIDFILSTAYLPEHVIKKVYGQTRTLVDILCEMNKERHFHSPEEAVGAIRAFVRSKQMGPDGTAWNFSLRTIGAYAKDCMTSRGLDIEKLYDKMEETFADLYHGVELVYKHYAIEKTIKMVELLNEFRRYTDPAKLLDDLWKIGVGANHCGPQGENYYFAFGSPHGGYVFHYLEVYTTGHWKEFAPNGTLDSALYKEFMYRRNARGIEKYGLNAVIERNYHSDGPCHPEVYFPYRGGAGAVYDEYALLDKDMRHTEQRRFVKSCGEGKGPNGIKDRFEFLRMRPLIEEDPNYVLLKRGGDFQNLLVPKDDVTLPLYHYFFGKLLFTTQEAKEEAIRKIWNDHPDLFPGKN